MLSQQRIETPTGRSKNALMKLLRDYLKTCIKRANKNNMKVRVIGDITGLSDHRFTGEDR